jgi:hypothetical protein
MSENPSDTNCHDDNIAYIIGEVFCSVITAGALEYDPNELTEIAKGLARGAVAVYMESNTE